MTFKPRFDPTITLGSILMILTLVFGGLSTWFSLLEKVSALKLESDLKFAQGDKNVAEIKDAIKEQKQDIQREIRDLKNDLRSPPIVVTNQPPALRR